MEHQATLKFNDEPIKLPENDLLGYSPFAKHLADSISKIDLDDGLVIGIYGEWGTGKSSLLNLVEHFLNCNELASSTQIVRFNPWWFSDAENIALMFFEHMISMIDPAKPYFENIRAGFSMLAKAAGPLIPYGQEAANILAESLRKNGDFYKQKGNLEKLLIEQKYKYVVFIDDIDRLTSREIRQLFKLIKAVGNLPNLVYILAFDNNYVAKALQDLYSLSGMDYLEKIVQIPFELPLPDRTKIYQIFFSRLNKVIAGVDENDFDQQRWGNVFIDGISKFINTPRDAIRLSNSLTVTFPLVEGEVNAIDFIAIESIRVFLPGLFGIIRDNPEMFVGSGDLTYKGAKDKILAYHDTYLEQINEEFRPATKQLLIRLFPRLEGIWGGTNYGTDWNQRWRSNKRICSASVFPTYFRLSLSSDFISFRNDIELFLMNANDQNFVMKYLLEISNIQTSNGESKAKAFLNRLEDYTDKYIADNNIEPIVKGLYEIADQLCEREPERTGIYDFGIEVNIGRITYQLLSRLSKDERFRILCEATNSAKSIGFVEREIGVYGQMHGKYIEKDPLPEDKQLIDKDQLAQLETLAVSRFEAAAISGDLVKSIQLAAILRSWREWSDGVSCREWILRNQTNIEFVIAILLSVLNPIYSIGLGFSGQGDRVAKKTYDISVKFLRTLVDVDQIYEILRVMPLPEFSGERGRLAVQTFIKSYEKGERDD